MRVILLNTDDQVAQWVANYIVYCINLFTPTPENPFILSIPAGDTPIKTYNILIQMYQSSQVSFKNVVIFIMDEYYGISYNDSHSYCSFIYKNFINHVDIIHENVNILRGNVDNIHNECEQYEKKIVSLGGIHLFIGGVGKNGHLAFNEPGSSLNSRTRITDLSINTRLSNAKFFDNNINSVPKFALTLGIATLLESKEIIIIATGTNKALAVQAAIEGSINHMWTISYLQLHPKSILVCDELSTIELKVKTVKYFRELEIND